MLKEKVEKLVEELLENDPALFILELKITPDNKIRVIVDSDKGVALNDIIAVSRHIEHNLDREAEDFSLEVTSPGATEPLTHRRQYNKNLGRKLKVKSAEGSFEGNLAEVTPEGIRLEWKAREPKPVGKGKVTVKKEKLLPFEEIEEAKVMITFN
ncbi:ribosome assembly cofactor RimP [Robertkochia aurantiaca]|uniref:ribosome assembly cofactor RimP n=1 Tax=Robertkochia aurantiaca TaxID=2873700 RepID=UPI001CCB1885|nr:ribosome assembly cofactor RimP [Robertkochia sp. 3YJGBD-33]